MNKLLVILITSLFLISSTPNVVADQEDSDEQRTTIKIGFLRDDSSVISVYQPGFDAAANIAEDHINSMQSEYNFEIIYADSGCSGDTGQSGAQSLINAGVVAIAGAACSGASMGANTATSAAGIPLISYASSSPVLSSDDYADFMRVQIVDSHQYHVMAHEVRDTGVSLPAIVFLNDDGFNTDKKNWIDSSWSPFSNIDTCIEYNIDDGWTDADWDQFAIYLDYYDCDSVVFVADVIDANEEAADMINAIHDREYESQLFSISEIFVDNYILNPDLLDDHLDYPADGIGVKFIGGYLPEDTQLRTAFLSECAQNNDCASGIYTDQAYDSIRLIAHSYMNLSIYSSLNQSMMHSAFNWHGASGIINFSVFGDRLVTWDLCEMTGINNGQLISSCDPILDRYQADPDFDGHSTIKEYDCQSDPNQNFSVPTDIDQDGICDIMDIDMDGDGFSNLVETECNTDQLNISSIPVDTDVDGICDHLDEDDDGDGWNDAEEIVCGTNSIDYSSIPGDFDDDSICDLIDVDDDNDGYTDVEELVCGSNRQDSSSVPEDFDLDMVCNLLDTDDDGDGVIDGNDDFQYDSSEWNDNDGDNIGDNADNDDDNDGVEDISDALPLDPLETIDTDGDGIGNNADTDDDNDGIDDTSDAFPLDPLETIDTDGDGIGNNADSDDDGDLWSDADEDECQTNSMDSESVPSDFDNDGICDLVDEDDDNDGFIDEMDAFQYDSSEWNDNDGDGIGNNADNDDDNDLLSDNVELSIGTNPLKSDTDDDGHFDSLDVFPLDSNEWEDTDNDGTGDNSDAYPSIARYQTSGDLVFDVILLVVIITILLSGVIFMRKKSDDLV